jgi:hypothetical protein
VIIIKDLPSENCPRTLKNSLLSAGDKIAGSKDQNKNAFPD